MKQGFITALLGVASLGLAVGGGGNAAGQSGYTSPFAITLDPAINAWTSDFAARQAAVDANTAPPKADWYAPSTSYAGYPYGPLLPQLYSTAVIGSGSLATQLQYDRGAPVFSVTMNAVPGGVDPTTWQRQRILAAATALDSGGTTRSRRSSSTAPTSVIASDKTYPGQMPQRIATR